jgi:hypothetical protein
LVSVSASEKPASSELKVSTPGPVQTGSRPRGRFSPRP